MGLTHVCSSLLELELTLNLVIDIEFVCYSIAYMYVYLLPSNVTENLVAGYFPSVVVIAGIMMLDQ